MLWDEERPPEALQEAGVRHAVCEPRTRRPTMRTLAAPTLMLAFLLLAPSSASGQC